MSEPLVHIRYFRMDFGSQTVIRDLSFDVHAGETFGFLGNNVSGKTTTLRALLGIYQPTAGTLHIAGRAFEPSRRGLGYLPEERGSGRAGHSATSCTTRSVDDRTLLGLQSRPGRNVFWL